MGEPILGEVRLLFLLSFLLWGLAWFGSLKLEDYLQTDEDGENTNAHSAP